ncbi:MAG: ABC transporter substrate-binding protein [Treponemataceae bacterium]
MKNVVKVVCALSVMLVALLGCTGQSAETFEKQLKIGMSFQEMKNQYFVVMNEALQEAGKSLGATIYTADAGHDVVKQISDIEDMIQKGINILIINPTDSKGVKAAVDMAVAKGVIVVAVDAQADGPIDSFVGSKNYDAGYIAGEHLVKELGGSGDVAILDGIPVVPILERVRGFQDAVAKYPDIRVVTVQNGRQERDYALTVTENMLQANPSLRGIFSVNDEGSLGALQALQTSGRDIKLVSVDGNPEAVAAIRAGGPFIATSAQYPRDMIRIGIGIALAKYWGANVPNAIPLDVKLIDQASAGSFSW